MPFEGMLGNARAFERMRGILRSGRPAHGYVLAGPDGVGKRRAAVEFAGALGARAEVVSRPEDRHEILISQVQEVIRSLSFASRDPRAVVFDEAHRMSEEAMNACLKTVEEPPARTTMLFITSSPQRLLPTLRSRCQTVLFFPLADEDIAGHARRALGLSEEDALRVAALAGGSPGEALRLSKEAGEIAAASRQLQERILKGELNPIVEALGKIRDTEQARRAAKRDLALICVCLREALASRWGAPARVAEPEFVRRLAALDEDELVGRIETLLEHERMIDLNANVGLAVEDALLRI